MARRGGRNPRIGKRGRTADLSDSDAVFTSDSDYVVHLSDEDSLDDDGDDEEQRIHQIPFVPAPVGPSPPPCPAAARRCHRQRRPRASVAVRRKRGEEIFLWENLEEEYSKWLDDHNPDDQQQPAVVSTADPPKEILLPLLRFQKEWLFWALKQEESEARGGILADEMGMGKTIQAISLVLTARSLRSSPSAAASCSSSSATSLPLPRAKATLVICPVVAVIQWVGEIEQHTERGSARVLVYHGQKRTNNVYDFNDYDFVLTTYSTIESDFRKYIMLPKEKCPYCEKLFYPKKLRIHQKYFCGPHAQKTALQSKQGKKKRKVHSALVGSADSDGGKGNGKSKKKVYEKKNGASMGQNRGKSVLHSVKWERIILDEAHFIKDRHSNTARAVFALESLYKWALSGTPLQNRVGELYSLVRFLQIYPYSCYFCKDCDCKILDYGSTQTCVSCPHASTRHFCWWNKYITKPIQTRAKDDEGKRAMVLLKEKLLKSMVLRRTKKGRAADLALPPRIVNLRRDTLDTVEQEFYEALYTQSCVKFDAYVTAGTLMNNYAHIFDLLTRLRQAVDHPYLVVYSKTAEVPEVPDRSKEDSVQDDCGICHDPAEDAVVTSCDHVFCRACLINYSATMGRVSCPSCSKPLTVDLTTNNNTGEKISATAMKGYKHSGILNRICTDKFKTSTKIDALREELRNMVEGDSSSKGIVFSQFTSFLDLIHFSLQRSGVKCVQLVGSMSLAEREKAIKTFTDDADCRIFLMSLKAGGVALNLTVASHVFLMDPWWNPAVERQAQDRIHRIGQYKPIKIVRFVIEDTIEERILKLQEKKELVFEGTIGASSEAMAKLTEADLRFLFHV